MTKKCYQKVASILAKYRNTEFTNYNENRGETIFSASVIIADFIRMFQEDNPRFNEEKFKKAIYGEENK